MPFDLAVLASYMTLDTLTKIAFGLEIDDLKDNTYHYNYQKSVANSTPIMNLCCNFETVFQVMNSRLILKIFKPLATDKAGPGVLLGVARKAAVESF